MAYQDELNKRQMVPFQELYEIKQGSHTYYYTSGIQSIYFEGKTYSPRVLKRSDFTNTTKLESLRLNVTTTIDNQLQKYIASAPPEPLTVKITRVFMTSTQESFVLFEGEAIDFTFQDNMVTVVLESRTHIFRNQIPKVVYQSFCNHDLFDSGCVLAENTYKVSAILSNVSGIELYSSTFDTYDDGYFTGGYVKADSDYRMITNHLGTKIVVQVPFSSSVGTNSRVFAYPGCDKKASTCKTKFNNFSNFLGFPYIPSSNPTLWGG